MKPVQLVLRCYAQQTRDGYWAAFCLDLTLYAVGDSFEEAREHLDEIIAEYVSEAIEGADRPYFDQLLPRRAPLSAWIKYYRLVIRNRLWELRRGMRTFKQPLPLVPARCHPH